MYWFRLAPLRPTPTRSTSRTTMKRRTQTESEAHAKRIHLSYFFQLASVSLFFFFLQGCGRWAQNSALTSKRNAQRRNEKKRKNWKGQPAEATFSLCMAFRRLLTTIGPIWKAASEPKRNVLNYCQNILRWLQCEASRRIHTSTTLVGNAVCYLFGAAYPVKGKWEARGYYRCGRG